MQDGKCHVCGFECERIAKHITDKHPEECERQNQLVLKYYKEGLSARKIAELPDVMYAGGTSVVRILNKYLTKEELEDGRKERISVTTQAACDTGERDWIHSLNTDRVKSDEGRQKNSAGLKKAYSEGTREAWNEGLTAKIDKRLAEAAEKQSAAMLARIANGNTLTLFKSGTDSQFWKEDRDTVSNLWRNNLNFQKNDREAIYERAGCKCEKCGITGQILDVEQKLLQDNRLTLECDHILSINSGGQRDWKNNGQALCSRCHIIKTLVEKNPNNELEINNRYNLVPMIILQKIFGGLFDVKTGLWMLNGVSVFISPLTKTEAETSRSLKEKSRNGTVIFYSDEWYNKREIVLSMIYSRLGLLKRKVYARDTDVCMLSINESKLFFNENHIAGHTNELFAMGLKVEGEVISAISFRAPFVEKHKGKIEIARFASKSGMSVAGGFSRLLAHSLDLVKERGFSQILTYADLRFGTGEVYAKNGFNLIDETKLDYHYTDGVKRLNRFKFRAQDGMSEADFAASKGVYKFYGCGSMIYEINIK